MKSVYNRNHSNKTIFHMLFLFLSLILIEDGNSLVSFTYPSAITLSNNNYFIVEQNGIYVYDKDFSYIVNSYTFTYYEKINYLSELSEVIIKYQNDYLICLIKSKIYFFDNKGNFLTKKENVIDVNYYHPTLAPLFVKNNYYYFAVGYFIPTYKLKLIYYGINLQNYDLVMKDDNVDDDFESYYYRHYDFLNKGLSCEYMLDDYAYKYYFLICFLIIKDGDDNQLTQSFYEVTDSEVKWTGSYRMSYIEEDSDLTKAIQIKSVTSKNLRFALVSVLISTNTIKYFKFRFEYGTWDKFGKFYETKSTNFNCRNSLYSMKLNYLTNNNNIVLSCINSGPTVQAMMFTDGLTEITSKSQFSFCQSIYGHTVLYSQSHSDYYVISDVKCGKYIRSYEPLEGELAEIIETTQLQIETTQLQIETTQIPLITTQLPLVTTQLPLVTTQLPLETTQLPLVTTQFPLETTQLPLETTQLPLVTTQLQQTTEALIITDIITEKITEKITDKQTEKISEQLTEKLTEQITEKIEKEKEEEKEEYIKEENLDYEKENVEIEIVDENEKEVIIEKEKEIETTIIPKEIGTEFSLFDCLNLTKCSLCNEESFNQKLCIKCNNDLGYFFLNKNPNSINHNKYINCVNEETKPLNYYFNHANQDYEMCYTTCETCEYFGDEEINNCTSCDEEIFTKNREEENSTNCVVKCKYYITDSNIRQCVKEYPEDYNLFIEEINKCIDDCKKDREYKYKYNGKCYKSCPNNTLDDNDYICKDIQVNKCFLSVSEVNYLNDNYTIDKAEILTIKYAEEFNYTDNHVSQYKDPNDIYRLTIYINSKCFSDLKLQIPEIDFQNCYQLVKDFYHINDNENMIIAVFDKKIEGTNIRKIISHGMFYLKNGKYLNPNDICKNEKITFVESVENKLMEAGIKIELYQDMAKEGIDLFNLSSPFYKDICFQYNSSKDIALKDRVLVYFPNISLCDETCELKGINMSSFEAICECLYSDTQNKDTLKENALVKSSFGDVEELLNSINIYVLKCVKLLTITQNITKCYGGYIIIVLFFIQVISTIIYCSKSLYLINKYVFGVIHNYLNYLHPEENNNNKRSIQNKSKEKNTKKINEPPKSKDKEEKSKKDKKHSRKSVGIYKKRNKSIKQHINFYFNNEKSRNTIKELYPQIDTINNNKNVNSNDVFNSKHHHHRKNDISYNFDDLNQASSKFVIQLKDDMDINFDEYLETELEKMEYYEAIKKDKRKFCTILCSNLRSNQLVINTFCMDEPLKPRPIKIILLTLQIDLYLFVNGLFFDEEYISNIFHLEKDDFKSIMERFIDNLLYATLVGVIIGYIIELFFVEEQKIKNILRMEKDNALVLKYETIKIMKSIKTRYVWFIILSLLISLFTIVHISCFNVVYHHTTMEWLIFSFIIILLIQLFSVFVCFLQSVLRVISFKFKSEKIYKLSLLLSEFL